MSLNNRQTKIKQILTIKMVAADNFKKAA